MTHRIIHHHTPASDHTSTIADVMLDPMPSQHFLITGGTGFIGRHLIASLLLAGHQVSVWTRSLSKASQILPDSVNIVENLHLLDHHQPVDVIINLAGSSFFEQRWSQSYQQELLRSRIALTHTLIQWVEKSTLPPRLVISGSSIYYYTNHHLPSMLCIDETTPKQKGFMADLCEQWELAAQDLEKLHIPVVRLRLGFVIGNGGILEYTLKKLRWGLGAIYHTGQQTFCWVHIQDVIRAILWITQTTPTKIRQTIYNIVSPHPVQQSEFMKTIAEIYHYKVHWHVSARILNLLLGRQRAELFLYGPRVVPAALLDQGFVFQFPDLYPAIKDIQSQNHR